MHGMGLVHAIQGTVVPWIGLVEYKESIVLLSLDLNLSLGDAFCELESRDY